MIYTDGTVAIKAGSPIVTGTGTQWKKNIHGVAPGQLICIENSTAPVSMMIRAVNSDTELVLSFNAPVTLSGAKYSIATTVPDTISDAARTMSANQGYIVYFLQAMQQWMTDTGQVEIELPNGQKVTLEDLKGLASQTWVNQFAGQDGDSGVLYSKDKKKILRVGNDGYLTYLVDGVAKFLVTKEGVINTEANIAALSDVSVWNKEKNARLAIATVGNRTYLSKFHSGKWQGETTIPDGDGTMATREWIRLWTGAGGKSVEYKNEDLVYIQNGCSFFGQNGSAEQNYFGTWGAGVHVNYHDSVAMRLFITGNNGLIITNVRSSNGIMVWNTLWGTANTTVDGNGFIKRSSPIIQIYPDDNYDTNDESEGAEVRRTGTGQYHITGILGYNSDGAWGVNGGISVPKDNNGLELVYIDDRVQSDGSLIIETCHRQHAHLPERFQNWRLKEITPEGERIFYQDGEPCDLPESTRLDVRVEMPQGSVWNVKQRELAEQMEREQAELEAQEAAEQAGDTKE
ncbi:hypothetical protein [Morganella morganii]|uniref:phage tail fiber protein n=1 Tax=Morganella morganii TaxID=582 RepID=UPI0037839FFD|nr:hypothetical protein SUGSMm_15790 [Morganella morganii subsp. sibonii]